MLNTQLPCFLIVAPSENDRRYAAELAEQLPNHFEIVSSMGEAFDANERRFKETERTFDILLETAAEWTVVLGRLILRRPAQPVLC